MNEIARLLGELRSALRQQIADDDRILRLISQIETRVGASHSYRSAGALPAPGLPPLPGPAEKTNVAARLPRHREIGTSRADVTVSLAPFWEPAENYASSRLRALYVHDLLKPATGIDASIGYDADSDVAVIVQLCDEPVMRSLETNADQFVIYDLCDPLYADDPEAKRRYKGLDVSDLCRRLVGRAGLVTVPTLGLKTAVEARFPGKPCAYVPEPIDYRPKRMRSGSASADRILWFGNPANGNFDSARWMMDAAAERTGMTPLIVSRAKYFSDRPHYRPHVVEWSVDAMAEAFAASALSLVAHPPDQPLKSANRLVTAVAHGVPTIASGSPECRRVLEAAECGFAYVGNLDEVSAAIDRLRDETERSAYLHRVQSVIERENGASAVRSRYTDILKRDRGSRRRPKSPVPPLSASNGHAAPEPTKPDVPRIATRLNSQLVTLYRARLRVLGVGESGVRQTELARLDQGRVVRPRDVYLAQYFHDHAAGHDTCYVMKPGLGALPLLLASIGVKTVAVERETDRLQSIRSALFRLGESNPLLEERLGLQRELVGTPNAGRAVGIFLGFTFRGSPDEYEAVFRLLAPYDAIVYQPHRFLWQRTGEDEVVQLEARLRRLGFRTTLTLPGHMRIARKA